MGLGLICGSEWGDLTALCIKRGLTPHFIPLRAAALDRNGRARSRGAPAEGWIVALGPDGRPFAILRVEKVKSLGELRGRGSHNARTAERGTEHCDPSEPPELIAGDPDAVAAWHRRAKACGVSPDHMRANGTVALEWMATASPEWFAKATPQQVAEWVRDSLAHIEERAGGAANILAAHVHLDETTPTSKPPPSPSSRRPWGGVAGVRRGSLPLPLRSRPGASLRATWWAGRRRPFAPSRTTTPRRWPRTVSGGAYPARRPAHATAPLPSTAPSWPRWGTVSQLVRRPSMTESAPSPARPPCWTPCAARRDCPLPQPLPTSPARDPAPFVALLTHGPRTVGCGTDSQPLRQRFDTRLRLSDTPAVGAMRHLFMR